MTLASDATERTSSDAERELRRLAQLGSLLEGSPHAALVHCDGVICWANRAAAALIERDPDELVGESLLRWVAPEHHGAAIGRMESVLRDGTTRGGADVALIVGSRRVIVEARAARITWEGRPAVHAVLWDVTFRQAAADRLAWEATHDGLTGLLNRSGIISVLDAALDPCAQGDPAASPVRVVMIDLDGFKAINDLLGHHAGDRLLARIGARIAEVSGPRRVGRLGGDEFLAVLDDPATDQTRFVERLLDAIAVSVDTPDGTSERIGASVGTATGIPGTTSVAELLASADQAMYRAKRTGRRRPPQGWP
jgi:diguanylate cyclase (GGDEF)-like protein/PAS domain S-box-containing protein